MGSLLLTLLGNHSSRQHGFGIMKVLICSLLVAGASCLPRAGHQFLYPAAPGPTLYHYKPVQVKAQANCVFEGAGSGEVVGEILLTETETPDGDTEVTITGELLNLSPGLHGFHVHEKGDLSDNCKGAGSHYNPFDKNHGAPWVEDRHVGGLGNIASNKAAVAVVRIRDHLVKLSGDTSVIGRAFVVHEGTDDLGLGGDDDSLTTGHAGARAGCCIINQL